MISMGIDQSTTCSGVFVMENDNVKFHTAIKSSPEDGDIYERVWSLSSAITDIAVYHMPDIICIEGLAMGARAGHLGDLGGLQHAIIMQLRFINGFDVKVVEPTVLKKFAFGKGNAKKWDMVSSCPDEIQTLLVDNYKFSSYAAKTQSGSGFDVADAYWLSQYAKSIYKK